MKKIAIVIVIVLVILLIGVYFYATSNTAAATAVPPYESTPAAPSCMGPDGGYNMGSDTLTRGQTIASCGGLKSQNGVYAFVIQADGNMVIYNVAANRPIWALNMNGLNANYTSSPPNSLVYQPDGNVVAYNSLNSPICATATDNRASDRLVMQNDGNLILYNGQTQVWASNTAGL